jgi:hypothetical protein
MGYAKISIWGISTEGGKDDDSDGDVVVELRQGGSSRCIESRKIMGAGGRVERTFRFLQTSQALQTLARTTLLGL